MRKIISVLLFWLVTVAAVAQELRVPERATAGAGATIGTSGAGAATFYLFGPAGAVKKDVRLGEEITLQPEAVRAVATQNGIAWTKLDSSKHAGAAQFVASVGGTSVRRVVQQTASDPCNLRFKVSPTKTGIAVETDPVRDCTGNPVPDGTIVTFI